MNRYIPHHRWTPTEAQLRRRYIRQMALRYIETLFIPFAIGAVAMALILYAWLGGAR